MVNPSEHRIGNKYPPVLWSTAEIEAVLALVPRRSSAGLRNRALIILAWRTGLRHAELLALRPSDIDLKKCHCRVTRGKGDKMRTVGLDLLCVEALSAWLTRRKTYTLIASAPVFCTITTGKSSTGGTIRPGQALKESYVRTRLKHYARKAGFDKRLTPHQLRHAFAVGLVEDGFDIVAVSGALGHSNLATTQVYVQTMAGKHVEAMKNRTVE